MIIEEIYKTVSEIFEYESIFNWCHYGRLIYQLNFKFEHRVFMDQHLCVYYDAERGHCNIKLLEIEQQVFECCLTKETLNNLNNYITEVTIFRHGAWEDYLTSLPGKLKHTHKAIDTLHNAQNFLQALENLSPIDDSSIFQ